MLSIHKEIKEKLNYYFLIKKIPNIIFYGNSGTGKKTIVFDFIEKIYNGDKNKINEYVMIVNCVQMKGIKLIREDIKFFAKTNINSKEGDMFKSIVLINADKLTIDAQSALRRLIEVFNHSTRFFIIVEDKYKLLKPIISRFCEIYVPIPLLNSKPINLYQYNMKNTMNLAITRRTHLINLRKLIAENIESKIKKTEQLDVLLLMDFCELLYANGYSGMDIINLFERDTEMIIGNITNSETPEKVGNLFKDYEITEEKFVSLMLVFNMVKKEIKNEKILMLFVLNFIFFDKNVDTLVKNIY